MNELRWCDLTMGQSAGFEVVVSEAMMQSFAEVSGDVNPLHLDATYARDAGFPGVVVFGLLTSSFYSRLVGVHLPGKRALLHGIDIEFKSAAFVNDRLSVSGEITFLSEAYKRIEIKASIRNRSGAVISRAKIRAGMREP